MHIKLGCSLIEIFRQEIITESNDIIMTNSAFQCQWNLCIFIMTWHVVFRSLKQCKFGNHMLILSNSSFTFSQIYFLKTMVICFPYRRTFPPATLNYTIMFRIRWGTWQNKHVYCSLECCTDLCLQKVETPSRNEIPSESHWHREYLLLWRYSSIKMTPVCEYFWSTKKTTED